MNWRSNKILQIAVAAILLASISCSESGKNRGSQKLYSIFLGEFKTQDKIDEFRMSLNPILWDQLRIEKIYDRNYKLYYGRYSSSFEAGRDAFDLHSNSLITKFKITHDGKPTLDEYSNVLFLSRYLDRPSVFNFNLITKVTELEWSEAGSKVVTLNHGEDHNSFFIVTSSRYGMRSGLKYIYDARVLLIKREEEQNSELALLGNGVQLYTLWENRDTLKVNLTFIDSVDSRIAVQKIYSFDRNGKAGKIQKRSFDIITEGFPAPPKRLPLEISPNNRFRFREVSSPGESYIYLRDFNEKSEQLTVSTDLKIIDGRWSDDGNYLYIVAVSAVNRTQKLKPGATGELFIIDAVNKKLVRKFSGFRYENLLVHGKLLFFDERSDRNAQIKVYDSKHDKILHTITMFGGCGLNNLPM